MMGEVEAEGAKCVDFKCVLFFLFFLLVAICLM